MVRMRSWRLTAEMRGGRWNNAPVNVSSALATRARPPSTCILRAPMCMHTSCMHVHPSQLMWLAAPPG